jgi:glutathione S-transferase
MRLYITPGSPYARMARIVVLEKGIADRIEILRAQTREANSPYYAICPSGRVPFLVRDDGTVFEESALICAWLDQLDGWPAFTVPPGEAGWEARRLEAMARSLMDGAAVWLRELTRPEHERSPGLIAHETNRASRMGDVWEREITHPWMRGTLNMAQITLVCALGMEARNPDFRWRSGRPALTEWFARLAARPSVAATAPT